MQPLLNTAQQQEGKASAAVADIRDKLEALDKAISWLSERIAPAVGPAPGEAASIPCKDKPKEAASPLVDSLTSIRLSIEQHTVRLNDLIRRIEL